MIGGIPFSSATLCPGVEGRSHRFQESMERKVLELCRLRRPQRTEILALETSTNLKVHDFEPPKGFLIDHVGECRIAILKGRAVVE